MIKKIIILGHEYRSTAKVDIFSKNFYLEMPLQYNRWQFVWLADARTSNKRKQLEEQLF